LAELIEKKERLRNIEEKSRHDKSIL